MISCLLSDAPKVFGWQHLTFLAISVVCGIASVILIKIFCKTEKSLNIAIKIYAGVLLFFILFNRICDAVNKQDAWHLLPGTFCGITSLAFAIAGVCAKKDSGVFHCLIYCALLGGLLTMFYPDFLEQDPSFFYPATFSGLMHHTVMFFLAVAMLATGYVRPTLKKWAWLPLGLCVMMVYAQFLISCLGFWDAMYINTPVLSGTPLTWYVVGAMFLSLHLIALVVIEIVRRKRVKKTTNENIEQDV